MSPLAWLIKVLGGKHIRALYTVHLNEVGAFIIDLLVYLHTQQTHNLVTGSPTIITKNPTNLSQMQASADIGSSKDACS